MGTSLLMQLIWLFKFFDYYCLLGIRLFALELLPMGYHSMIKLGSLPLTTPWNHLWAIRNTAAWNPSPEGLISWSGVQPQHWDFLNFAGDLSAKAKLRNTGLNVRGVTNSNSNMSRGEDCGELESSRFTQKRRQLLSSSRQFCCVGR